MEPVIRQKYADVTGVPVTVPTETFRHPEHPFMIANVDGAGNKEYVNLAKMYRPDSFFMLSDSYIGSYKSQFRSVDHSKNTDDQASLVATLHGDFLNAAFHDTHVESVRPGDTRFSELKITGYFNDAFELASW